MATDLAGSPAPDLLVPSLDGTPIAVFDSDGTSRPPLLLVHGATADHTAFRVLGPLLAPTFAVHAIDRRGRGASGDAAAYAIGREFEDVAAVAETLVALDGEPLDVVGHSYGGRIALGAALLTDSIARVVCYEGAPTAPGTAYHSPEITERLRARLRAGDGDGALALFMAEVVGMSEVDLATYRANPIWPVRVAAAHTILRELESEGDPAASLDRLGSLRRPVLQILGGESLPVFRDATLALDARLVDGRVAVIEGARHAAHHTHPEAMAQAIRAFLG